MIETKKGETNNNQSSQKLMIDGQKINMKRPVNMQMDFNDDGI